MQNSHSLLFSSFHFALIHPMKWPLVTAVYVTFIHLPHFSRNQFKLKFNSWNNFKLNSILIFLLRAVSCSELHCGGF